MNCDPTELRYENGEVCKFQIDLRAGVSNFRRNPWRYSVRRCDLRQRKKLSYSYGAHAAQIALDITTGLVKVERYWLTEEIGRALNPAMIQGQAVGGVIQGLGGTFLDHFIYDDGQLLTGSFADYLLPTSSELPEITAIALENFLRS